MRRAKTEMFLQTPTLMCAIARRGRVRVFFPCGCGTAVVCHDWICEPRYADIAHSGMNTPPASLKPTLAWIAIILTVVALRESRGVTMPLAVGLFLATLAWPLQKRLQRRMRPGLSLTITLLAFWTLLAVFVAALVLCATAIAEGASDYAGRFTVMVGDVKTWLQHKGLPQEFFRIDAAQTTTRVVNLLGAFAAGLYNLFGQFILVAVYFFLALLEVGSFQRKLQAGRPAGLGPELLAASVELTTSIQRFIVARSLISLALGVLTASYTAIIGLRFPLVWGLSAFLLNYIPIFGAVVAVLLPTLLAFIQPQGLWLVPATFLGLGLFHVVLGNYVDPWMQGKYLALSPLVLFLSVTFWGWVWGVAGVLLSVPLTAAVAIVCKHFAGSRWAAHLLMAEERHKEP
jgi:AI-2 transport protein TqsA